MWLGPSNCKHGRIERIRRRWIGRLSRLENGTQAKQYGRRIDRLGLIASSYGPNTVIVFSLNVNRYCAGGRQPCDESKRCWFQKAAQN
jgi:hypothetical protein